MRDGQGAFDSDSAGWTDCFRLLAAQMNAGGDEYQLGFQATVLQHMQL